jgi:reactive intermediate/imine deaminase
MKVEVIRSDAPQPLANYSEAFRVGDLVFAAGQIASDYKTGVPPEARTQPNFPYYGSDIKLQTRYILGNLKKTFEAAGSSLDNVVKAQVFMTDLKNFNAFDEVWKEFFPMPPARTTVGTTGLLVKDTLVEIDLIGVASGVKPQVVKSEAPRPLAHYNEAFRVGDLVFAAGQIASDYKTGVPPEARLGENFPYYGSDIKKQTRYILENLKKTFEAAGSSLEHVVKAQVFMTDLMNFSAFDEVWKEFFPNPPARTTVGTTGLLVKDTLVEIDLVGVAKGAKPQMIKSEAPRPLAHYNEGFRVGDLVFAAGQIASDYKTGVPAEARLQENFPYYGSEIKKQTRYILGNLKKTFEAAGSSLDRVIKAQVFMTDLANFSAFDEVWKEFFPKTPPARTTVGTTGLLVKDTLVEIDLIGVAG